MQEQLELEEDKKSDDPEEDKKSDDPEEDKKIR